MRAAAPGSSVVVSGLTRESSHGANASWFRVRDRVKVDDWSTDPAWRGRVPSGERWMSTNHLMGKGYWVWLIPLGSGSTSFGIVADDQLHPFHRINRFDRALEWLHEYEPQCAEYVEQQRDNLEDFLALRHYAHGCARVYSADRWALTGEAGVFTDPFYSPGSDFIAIGNECIIDLITRDARGEEIAARVEELNTNYLRLFDALHPVVQRPIPADGQRTGDDGQSGVGQRHLLGGHRRALFSAPVRRSRIPAVHRFADEALLRPACALAGVLPRMGRARQVPSTRRAMPM